MSSLFADFDDKLYDRVKNLHLSAMGPSIIHEMDILLNPMKQLGSDWRKLAEKMGYDYNHLKYIMSLKTENFFTFFNKCMQEPLLTVGKLIDSLHEIGRKDVLEVIISYQKDIRLPENVIDKIPPCVFVTYDDGQSHILQVGSLVKFLKKHGIHIFTDIKNENCGQAIPVKTKWRYHRSDIILVCISQTYDAATKKIKTGKDVNTAGIFRLMQDELDKKHKEHETFDGKQYIPILLNGTTKENAPEWIQKECKKFYRWPDEYEKIIKHIRSYKH